MLQQNIIQVERAIDDLKRGLPIIINDGKNQVIAAAAETLNQTILDFVQKISNSSPRLVITKKRYNMITKDAKASKALAIDCNDLDLIAKISGLDSAALDTNITGFHHADKLDNLSLKIIKLAELLPSAIVAKLDSPIDNQLIVVTKDAIEHYQEEISLQLVEACQTPIVLDHAPNAKITAFRPNIGGKEHYAIIINDAEQQKAPLVRIHSSCYTGDLLASLACDCRDQLHEAIRIMGENDGGIILYLMQEGRGIGLTNKLRAYYLKEQGLDTVDANEYLGFDDDERQFLPAVKMLEKLKVKTIKLLSNNKRKAKGLEEHGIKVTKVISHIMQTNIHNEKYLKTKADRLGHKL